MKPYVICHMMPSIDGRIVLDGWPKGVASAGLYDKTADQLKTQAWLCGRVTMQEFAGPGQFKPKGKRSSTPKSDFVIRDGARSFAIAVDPSGKLNWESNDIDGDRLISILTERATSAYLDFLRSKGISYIFAGKTELDFSLAFEKLRDLFGIRRLSIQGGGTVNGSILREGLIDEISVVYVPVVDGRVDKPSVYDVKASPRHNPAKLKLTSMKRLANGAVWLRYRVVKGR